MIDVMLLLAISICFGFLLILYAACLVCRSYVYCCCKIGSFFDLLILGSAVGC